jgi:hypothetical protein
VSVHKVGYLEVRNMAFHLEKAQTNSTPYILIDEEKGYMKFEGRSFHENVAVFYTDVNDWLDTYLKKDFGSFTFDFEMNYFNSSTSKLLHNLLMRMDKYASEKNKVVVNWITTKDNDIIIECGEDFQEDISNLEFNMVIR